jgi:uncharacterized protein (DUF2236 family)
MSNLPSSWGAGRALLLQLAHPAVDQGVQDHSDFKRNPFKRLGGTLEATMSVVLGTEELAAGIGQRVAEVFGVPDSTHPETLADFEDFMSTKVHELELSIAGRDLCGFILGRVPVDRLSPW